METTCETCGQPCSNIDRAGDSTGKHRDIEECLRAMGRRVALLERQQRNHMARDTGGRAL